jgi:hypothetical protein
MSGCWCRTAHGILCVSRILGTLSSSEIYIFYTVLYKMRMRNTGTEYILYSLEH